LKNKFLFSVFVYFIILVLISLGSWQLYRLNWKLDLIKQIEDSLKNKPIELTETKEENFLRVKTSGRLIFKNRFIYIISMKVANLGLR
jgi:surfeit locus 1 family protein